jgi:DNA-binding NarL/FixJ family response regulator
MKKIRILIADDHSIVREGVRLVLRSSPSFAIVGEAEDGEQAVALAARLKPDVVVMDITMPKLGGIDATIAMKKANPALRIVILTVHEDEEYIQQMLKAGANGYVLKTAGRKEIFAAIRSAMAGEQFFSPGVSGIIVDRFLTRNREEEVGERKADTPAMPLTKREVEILRLITQGMTNRMIADELYLSVRTVNTHRTNLMQKLDIHDTATLVQYALRHDVLKPAAGEAAQTRVPT